MKNVIQRTEKFFELGTLGYENGKNALENVISRINSSGWRVDQIVPLSFRSPSVSVPQGMDVTSGILLCSKIE